MNASATETRIAELEAALAAERAALAAEWDRSAKLAEERDLLRASHERLRFELELLKRRIFVAKAERVDTAQLSWSSQRSWRLWTGSAAGRPPASAGATALPPRSTSPPAGAI
jgi:hypothetical protein